MASGLLKNGVDLDNLFEARSSTAIANTGILVGGVDIANRYEKLASGSAIAAVGFKVSGADLNTLFAGIGTVVVGTSITFSTPGTYYWPTGNSATTSATFTVIGGGGGGGPGQGDNNYANHDGSPGGASSLTFAGSTILVCNGGSGGGDGNGSGTGGAGGTVSNTGMTSGTATNGGKGADRAVADYDGSSYDGSGAGGSPNGGTGGWGYDNFYWGGAGGGGGGKFVGSKAATFNSTHQVTIVVGAGGAGGPAGDAGAGLDGGAGSVTITWQETISLVLPTSASGQPWTVSDSGGVRYNSNAATTIQIVTGRATSIYCWAMDGGDWNEWWDNFTIRDGSTTGTVVATSLAMPGNNGNGGVPNTATFTPVAGHTYYVVSTGAGSASW